MRNFIMDVPRCIILLAIASLSQQIMSDESMAIIGDDLDGPNVCKRIEPYNVTVVTTEMVPYQEIKNVWCASIPPRCRKVEIKLRQKNNTEVLHKTRPVKECCEGFKENEQKNRCVPHCSRPCVHGHCAAPDQCNCESSYGGPSCNFSKFPLALHCYATNSSCFIL